MAKNKDVMVALQKFENFQKQKSVALKLGEFLTTYFNLFSIFTYVRIIRSKILQNVLLNEYHGL